MFGFGKPAAPAPEEQETQDEMAMAGKLITRRRALGLIAGAGALTLLGGFRGIVLRRPDHMDDFSKVVPPKGGSYVVAIMIKMLERELDRGWYPSAIFTGRLAVNKQGFQIGIERGCEGTAYALREHVARLGTDDNDYDPDINEAHRRLTFPPDEAGVFLEHSTVDQIQKAIEALIRYNQRLATGKAVYDHRLEGLLHYIERDCSDFGSYVDRLDKLAKRSSTFGSEAQNLYYQGRGLLEANYSLYVGLRKDFKDVVEYFAIGKTWDNAMELMQSVAEGWEMPPLVMNANAGSTVFASQLETLSGGLSRVQVALRSISRAATGRHAELSPTLAPERAVASIAGGLKPTIG
jgi:hypothetical protein